MTRQTSSSSQRTAMLDVLKSGGWVPLPRILELHISQYGARIHELRKLGYRIENKAEQRDGKRCTAFRLVSSPAQVSSPARPPAADRDDNPQTIPPNVKSDPREQLQLFSERDPR